jgi:hypothetical protein
VHIARVRDRDCDVCFARDECAPGDCICDIVVPNCRGAVPPDTDCAHDECRMNELSRDHFTGRVHKDVLTGREGRHPINCVARRRGTRKPRNAKRSGTTLNQRDIGAPAGAQLLPRPRTRALADRRTTFRAWKTAAQPGRAQRRLPVWLQSRETPLLENFGSQVHCSCRNSLRRGSNLASNPTRFAQSRLMGLPLARSAGGGIGELSCRHRLALAKMRCVPREPENPFDAAETLRSQGPRSGSPVDRPNKVRVRALVRSFSVRLPDKKNERFCARRL